MDTGAKNAKLTFGVKSLVNDLYLELKRQDSARARGARASWFFYRGIALRLSQPPRGAGRARHWV